MILDWLTNHIVELQWVVLTLLVFALFISMFIITSTKKVIFVKSESLVASEHEKRQKVA